MLFVTLLHAFLFKALWHIYYHPNFKDEETKLLEQSHPIDKWHRSVLNAALVTLRPWPSPAPGAASHLIPAWKEANWALKYSIFSTSIPNAFRHKPAYHYFSFHWVFLMTNFDCELLLDWRVQIKMSVLIQWRCFTFKIFKKNIFIKTKMIGC